MSKQSHSHDDQPEALRLARNLRTGRLGYEETLLPAAHALCHLHVDNQTLRTDYAAARLEIASLQARVQEVGAMAKENRSRAILELEDRIMHLANNLNTQQQARAHADFTSECYEKDLSAIAAAVPAEKYPDSKDWRDGCTLERIQWLHSMYESSKSEAARLEAQLDAVGAGGVEPLRKRECLHQITPLLGIDSPFNACMYQEHCKQWRNEAAELKLLPHAVLWEKLLKAAVEVNEFTQIAHRPPVRDQLEFGRMVSVRLHALADLYDATQAVNAAHGITNHETGCGACGDGCKSRGSCRLADESPERIANDAKGGTA